MQTNFIDKVDLQTSLQAALEQLKRDFGKDGAKIRKLKYLSKITRHEDGLSYRTFSSLVDDVESPCLVRECRELEGRYKSDYTSKLLATEPEERQLIFREMEQVIVKNDQVLQLKKASQHPHLCKIAETVGWRKL